MINKWWRSNAYEHRLYKNVIDVLERYESIFGWGEPLTKKYAPDGYRGSFKQDVVSTVIAMLRAKSIPVGVHPVSKEYVKPIYYRINGQKYAIPPNIDEALSLLDYELTRIQVFMLRGISPQPLYPKNTTYYAKR